MNEEESERLTPHATGNADTKQYSPEALARETVLRFRGKLSDPETFEYLYENILAAINAALDTERPPPHATGSTEPNIVAREAAEKLMRELEEAGYLDFDGGEQEERTDWLNRFTKSYLAAMERAKAAQPQPSFEDQQAIALTRVCLWYLKEQRQSIIDANGKDAVPAYLNRCIEKLSCFETPAQAQHIEELTTPEYAKRMGTFSDQPQGSELEKIKHKLRHFTGQTFVFSEVEFLFNALADARENIRLRAEKMQALTSEAIVLRKQLADERKNYAAWRIVVNETHRQKLATERQLKQKALGDWAHELDRANTLDQELTTERQRADEAFGAYKAEIKSHQRTNDLLIAERQDQMDRDEAYWKDKLNAEVSKPLVDALKQISEHCSRPSRLATVFCDDIKRITDAALAKAKEGK